MRDMRKARSQLALFAGYTRSRPTAPTALCIEPSRTLQTLTRCPRAALAPDLLTPAEKETI